VIDFATDRNLFPTEPEFAQGDSFVQQHAWLRRSLAKNVYFDRSSGFISINISPVCVREGSDFYAQVYEFLFDT